MNMFEKIANMVGVLYRHQANQFPRRYAILKVYIQLFTKSSLFFKS